MDRCPICEVPVKPENLLRHVNDIHPRHPDAPSLRERLKEEPGRIPKTRPAGPIRIRRWHVVLVVAIVLGGITTYYLAQALAPPRPLPCISQEGGIRYHWHASFSISSGSSNVRIPAGIGLSFGCIQPLHTHSEDGQIHVESDTNELYTIGQFFQVWNKPWGNPTQMHVNGTLFAPNPGQILYDATNLHLQYDSFS